MASISLKQNQVGNFSQMDVSMDHANEDIDVTFSEILKRFRIEFSAAPVTEIVHNFREASSKAILSTFDSDPEAANVEDWVLETKLWSLVETLLNSKFLKVSPKLQQEQQQQHDDEYTISVQNTFGSYTSDLALQQKIIDQDDELKEIQSIIMWLSETFQYDLTNSEDNVIPDDLQTIKWCNTQISINSIPKFSTNLVKNLDADAPLRNRNSNIDPKDQVKDELFFKKAFHLLLANEVDNLTELAKTTNNWNFAMALTGLEPYCDPAIDLSISNKEQEFETSTKPVGTKHQLLLKKSLYQLTKYLPAGFEKGCYGFLCGDFISTEPLTKSWERTLLLYLNNLFKSKLETKLIEHYRELEKEDEISLIASLPSPTQAVNSISEALNLLAVSHTDEIRNESEHPIRVLIGSVISDNIPSLMENSLKLLSELLTGTNPDTTIEELSESYLLRILVHFAILIQLIYDDKYISNEDYTALLKSYVTRLAVLKHYDLIPVYISFIPKDNDLIETYSFVLSSFEFTHEQRAQQLSIMHELNIPIPEVLKITVATVFQDTASLYPVDVEIKLDQEVTSTDKKLYSSIYWFYDCRMFTDCLDAITQLFRRLLLCGKTQAAIEFLDSINFIQLLKDTKFQAESKLEGATTAAITDVEDLSETDDTFWIRVQEVTQYHKLLQTIKALQSFKSQTNQITLQEVMRLSSNIKRLLQDWFFDLYQDENVSIELRDTYQELRRVYLPSIFNTLFEIYITFGELSDKLLIKETASLVNLLADEKYKLYEIFLSTGELESFLKRFAGFSCYAYGELEDGVFTV
ncbi:unnamed protein product [Ambrosiozyma monospora]|uniref:Nuclear pore complex protein n=1 Tax=Ambrosiozyma monospora TaxID=43982 RepID=A0A9W6YVB2_AMBMO|nr:unnamed protein product [Ambrosiozyma monospora]